MKLKDCAECQHTIKLWSIYLNHRNPAHRAQAKREIQRRKRDHSKLRRHDWPWKNYGNAYVSGCYNKTLIHKGRK